MLERRRREVTITVEDLVGSRPPAHDVAVSLGDITGPDGNANAIIRKVEDTLRRALGDAAAAAYVAEVRNGDYEHVLDVTASTVHATVVAR